MHGMHMKTQTRKTKHTSDDFEREGVHLLCVSYDPLLTHTHSYGFSR
jgi:hypothetical protein